jgi:molybdopterin/thiamine biosynthesis adenylyltransferase
MNPKFDYDLAFSRNLGWITEKDQKTLRNSKIAIAGMGGVGGVHLLTLARLGISQFNISDFDIFEIPNFNRQVGADMTTIGMPKVEVLRDKALCINPDIKIKIFPQGVNELNIDEFLEGVELYVDGLDVFELDLREKIFRICRQKNITVISVAPIGMGVALVALTPTGMSSDDYFGFSGKSQIEKYCRFILGLAPKFLYLPSLVDRSFANAYEKKAPSLAMGCELAAGVMGTEVLKHILNRNPRLAAPWSIHFDAATYRLKKSWIPGGCRNPIFKIKLKIIQYLIAQRNKKI